MSEMIKRAATAAYAELARQADDNCRHSTAFIGDGDPTDGATTLDGNFDLMLVAKAIIAAMRQPTPEVLDAAGETSNPHATREQRHEEHSATWQAMIDAALK